MSPKTAPAGYSCPICRKMCIFPAHNQISPIADELKKRMSQVNWARAGLGLSLVSLYYGYKLFFYCRLLKIIDNWWIVLLLVG